MGSRGPQKTNNETLKLRGSRRADRAERPGSRAPGQRAPACPSSLSKEIKAERRKVIRDLKAAGTLHPADRHLVVRYAVLRLRWRKNVQLLDQMPMEFHVYNSNAGDKLTMPNALVAILQKIESQLLQMEKELGLTPGARRRMEVPEERPPQKPGLVVRDRSA